MKIESCIIQFLYLFYNSDDAKKKQMVQFVNKKSITQTNIWEKKNSIKKGKD